MTISAFSFRRAIGAMCFMQVQRLRTSHCEVQIKFAKNIATNFPRVSLWLVTSPVAAAEGLKERLRALVRTAGSQRKLAEIIGTSDVAISGWMRGSIPTQKTLEKIAARTGVSIEWLRDGRGSGDTQLNGFRSRISVVSPDARSTDPAKIRYTPMICGTDEEGGMSEHPAAYSPGTTDLDHLSAATLSSMIEETGADPHLAPSERSRLIRACLAALMRKTKTAKT